MHQDDIGKCWHCGQSLTSFDYARENRCTSCSKSTHVCRNCQFFSPSRSNDCEEPIAEHVADKSQANFCDYFKPNDVTPTANAPDKDAILKAAADLFK